MYLTNIVGSSAHKFHGVLGSRGGLPKCLKIFSWKMMGTASKKLKWITLLRVIPTIDMLGGGCQVRVVIENMMGRMENLRTLISGFLGLVILVRWALVTMFLSWTTQTGCRIHRTYVSLIGSGEGRHTTHLLKCVPLLSTSQTDWKQSSDVLSDISFDILSDISSDIFFLTFLLTWFRTYLLTYLSDSSSDISSDILSDISSDILSDISFHMLSDISSDILSDISKPKPNIHSFTQKAALQTLYLPHTTQQK